MNKLENKKPWSVTYSAIQQRCENKKRDGYKNYGGRGIKALITLAKIESRLGEQG